MSNRRLRRSSSGSVIERAKDGDEDAFGDLFRDNHAILLRYARGLGTRQPEDVVSQVWFEAARSLSTFDGDESAFRAWLFTICRRRVIDAHRGRTRRPETLVADPTTSMTAPAADEELDAADRAVELMASLPHAQAEVIMLRVIAGLTVEEVAELTDRRPGTVRVLAHRGLRQLGKLLQAPAEPWSDIDRIPSADGGAEPGLELDDDADLGTDNGWSAEIIQLPTPVRRS